MRDYESAARALAVRAYIAGLRLEPECLEEWHPYLERIEDKGRLPRRPFYRFVLWVCATEQQFCEYRIRMDTGYREPFDGLHRFLRTTGFLSEFGRARRSWFHVDKMLWKRRTRQAARRLIHDGLSVWADLCNGIKGLPMSRGFANDRESSLRYVRTLIADWREGFCGEGPRRALPDRVSKGDLRTNANRRLDLAVLARTKKRHMADYPKKGFA